MAEFPKLRSGGGVQYPVRRSHGPTHTGVHFWGGGGQMYQRRKSPPLSWGIEFAGLSEDEASLLVGFCERHIAENTLFSFCDPVTGAMHDRCAVIPDSMMAACSGISAYEFRATIIEIEE